MKAGTEYSCFIKWDWAPRPNVIVNLVDFILRVFFNSSQIWQPSYPSTSGDIPTYFTAQSDDRDD